MTTQRLIVVCGISGVGKTYLIDDFVRNNPHSTRLSAGSIVAAARTVTDPELLRRLSSSELKRSQELLISEFPNALARVKSQLVLLDAHMIIDNGDTLYVVEDEVFAAFGPDCIVHVNGSPEAISQQRTNDRNRARPFRSPEELAEHQCLSMQHSRAVAARLNVRFEAVQSGDTQSFSGKCRQLSTRS